MTLNRVKLRCVVSHEAPQIVYLKCSHLFLKLVLEGNLSPIYIHVFFQGTEALVDMCSFVSGHFSN